jgi:hypothetical protein
VTDWPAPTVDRNVNQFPAPPFHPSTLPLPHLPCYQVLSTAWAYYAVVAPPSLKVSQPVATTIIPLVLQQTKNPLSYLAFVSRICLTSLQAPLKAGPLHGRPSHQRHCVIRLHHPVVCHLQDPTIHPRVALVAPLDLETEQHLTPSHNHKLHATRPVLSHLGIWL